MIVSAYSMDLYCKKCEGKKYDWPVCNGSVPIDMIVTDGPNCYHEARRRARKRGWILHKDFTATCPKCNPKHKSNNN